MEIIRKIVNESKTLTQRHVTRYSQSLETLHTTILLTEGYFWYEHVTFGKFIFAFYDKRLKLEDKRR